MEILIFTKVKSNVQFQLMKMMPNQQQKIKQLCFEEKILSILSNSMLDLHNLIENYRRQAFGVQIQKNVQKIKSTNLNDNKSMKNKIQSKIDFDQDSSSLSQSQNQKSGKPSESMTPVPKKKKIVKKKVKIPGMPKPPPNSFVLYLQQRKYQIQKGNPSMSIAAVTSVASKQWKQLGQDQKKIYRDQYEQSKVVYNTKKQKFMEQNKAKIQEHSSFIEGPDENSSES